MKKIISINLIVIAMLCASFSFGQVTNDTLSLEPGYSMDVFYSMENGEVLTADRLNWHLGFYTQRFSAGILVNDGLSTMTEALALYTYPNGDTSAWQSIDTSGMSSWTPMYNSETVWEDGAFNRNFLGHPDYGWGVYNMVNHHVYGDSLFVIDIPGVGIKKLWIQEKKSVDNIFIFKYADLDGKNLEEVELDVKPYESKRFVYYSLTDNQVVDREPDAESWDILFTKYIDMVEDNEGNFSPYPVTGATANVNIGTSRFHPVAPDFNDWYSVPFDSVKHSPGWDWKEFNLGEFSWEVLDSNYYFVQNYAGDVYKLWFTYWEGSSTGKFALAKELVSLASIEEPGIELSALTVYPNPAGSSFTVQSAEDLTGTVKVNIVDFTGRMILMQEYSASDLRNGISFNDLDLTEGMYVINVRGESYQTSQKLIIR